jgi:hypothetical protein
MVCGGRRCWRGGAFCILYGLRSCNLKHSGAGPAPARMGLASTHAGSNIQPRLPELPGYEPSQSTMKMSMTACKEPVCGFAAASRRTGLAPHPQRFACTGHTASKLSRAARISEGWRGVPPCAQRRNGSSTS